MQSYLLPLYFVATLSTSYCLSLVMNKLDGKQVEIPMLSTGFVSGEKMYYRLHYGFITAGRAEMTTIHANVPHCIMAKVEGRSIGAFDLMIRIRDAWHCVLDTLSWLPYKSYRFIEEGNYNLKETTLYNHTLLSAMVYREQRNRPSEFHKLTILPGSQDIVSGFYQLRRIDYNRMQVGDTLALPVFFDKEKYIFKLRFMGKGVVQTDAGKFRAIKLVPIMPPNALFNGEQSIKAWISDDAYRIPVLAEATMFVGSVRLDLTHFEGLGPDVAILR